MVGMGLEICQMVEQKQVLVPYGKYVKKIAVLYGSQA